MNRDKLVDAATYLGILILGLLAAALFLAPGCALIPKPDCVQFAQTNAQRYADEGWQVLGRGPAGKAAEFVVFARKVPDTNRAEVHTWVFRANGSDPDDATLVADGFAQVAECQLGADNGPHLELGTFWLRKSN